MLAPFTRSYQRPELTDYDFFSAEDTKSADLTIYYNVALDAIGRIKGQMESWPHSRKNAFWAEYLWKAHFFKKNSNGYVLTDTDERMIKNLLDKLEAIRNYHSHIWHDNKVLAFEPELKEFVEQKYNEAKAALYVEFPNALLDYEKLEQQPKSQKFEHFKWVPEKNKHFITPEGRVFFLSFFLTTGQMSQLLQQRRGSKRADMPLFKIKRLLYTYYCRRDGASMNDFNHQEHFIDTMDPLERRDIFKARTAYKLMSYLFDYPWFWGSRHEMPLYNEHGEVVKNVEQLKAYIEKNNSLLPGLQFQLIERKLAVNTPVDSERERSALIKTHEDKHRMGTIAFTSDVAMGHIFHIDFDTLHRLVLMQLLHNSSLQEQTPIGILQETLKALAANRERLYSIILTRPDDRIEDELQYLLDKKNQHLRGERKLTELGIGFFEALEKGLPEKRRDSLLLANFLRSQETRFIELPVEKANQKEVPPFEPDPIIVYQQDFLLGTTQKFRAGNRFMHYAANYLMDFGSDHLYWGMEKFDLVKKDENARTESLLKIKSYFKAFEMPPGNDYRLTLENDHVYLALPKSATGEANHEKFYQFAIGTQAMRYLMAYLLNQKDASAEKVQRFLDSLAYDLRKLQEQGSFIEGYDYQLLEMPFVLGFLQNNTGNVEALKRSVIARIDYILQRWEKAKANKQYMSRSEKNRLIMDAYRLFEWPKGNDENPRFFRAAEYNEMSVCHYSLHRKENNNKPAKQTRGKIIKNKFDYLFEDLFKLNERKPPIPREIKNLLQQANTLDELIELVIADRANYLKGKQKEIQQWILPVQKQKQELPPICRMLGISVPAETLREQDRIKLKQKQQVTLAVQPFAIHPMLVVKYFFPEEYQAGKQMESIVNREGKTVDKRPALTIFANIRKNKGLRDKLVPEFYDTDRLVALYPAPAQKKQKEALVALINTTCTEDMLLWKMCNEYMNNNRYTKMMGEFLQKQRSHGRKYVGEFHQLLLTVPLSTGSNTRVYMQLLMHQLDDLMFAVQQSRLGLAARHFLARCGTTERECWNDELQKMIQNQLGGVALPDGSPNNPIPFNLLTGEMELVRRTGQGLAKYFLEFEKKVLRMALKKHGNNKHAFHQWLKEEYAKEDYGQKFPVYYFNFESILKLANTVGFEIGETDFKFINEYRNLTFHNDIPEHGSFSWVTRAGQPLRELLQIEKDLHEKKDRSGYEVQGDKQENLWTV